MKRVFTVSLLAFAASASSASAQGFPLAVEFRPPSTLEIGPTPLPGAVDVNLAWAAGGVGDPVTDNVTLTLTGSAQPSSIFPSPSGMAITTKGYGFPINRVKPTPATTTVVPIRGVRLAGRFVSSSSPSIHVSQHDFDLFTDSDNDGTLELSSQRLRLSLEMNLFQGVQFAEEPRFVSLADGSFEIITALTTPPGVVLDPALDVSSYRFSAQIVPTPGAVAVLGLGGLLAARRRR